MAADTAEHELNRPTPRCRRKRKQKGQLFGIFLYLSFPPISREPEGDYSD